MMNIFSSPVKIIIICFITIFTACRCDNKKNAPVPSLPIDPNMSEISMSLSDLLVEIEIVRFETRPECLLSRNPRLILLDKEKIFISSAESILIFDRKGKYLSKVDAKGKGPQEYTRVTVSFVDSAEKSIQIVDEDKIKIYGYTGNYIKTLDLPVRAGGAIRNAKGQMLIPCVQIYNTNNRDMLYLLNSDLSVKHIFKSKNPVVLTDVQQNFQYYGNPYETGNRLFYSEPFVDTIFEIADTSLIPHWHINLGKYKPETRVGLNVPLRRNATDKIFDVVPRESEKYFFIEYNFDQGIYMSVFNKLSGSYIFHQKYTREDFPNGSRPVLGIKNDMLKNVPAFWPKFFKDDLAISLIDPIQCSEDFLKDMGINIDDNSLLFIGRLK